MVAHHRIGADLNSKGLGESGQAIDGPLFAEGIILAGKVFGTPEKGATGTTADAVVIGGVG